MRLRSEVLVHPTAVVGRRSVSPWKGSSNQSDSSQSDNQVRRLTEHQIRGNSGYCVKKGPHLEPPAESIIQLSDV
jgi:hypothetical protein